MAAVLAAANLPTPLYPHYQRADHLSTATLTVVFAAYVVTVAATRYEAMVWVGADLCRRWAEVADLTLGSLELLRTR